MPIAARDNDFIARICSIVELYIVDLRRRIRDEPGNNLLFIFTRPKNSGADVHASPAPGIAPI